MFYADFEAAFGRIVAIPLMWLGPFASMASVFWTGWSDRWRLIYVFLIPIFVIGAFLIFFFLVFAISPGLPVD